MQISQSSVNFAIKDEDRPFIEFERVLNKGTKARKEKRDDKGKVTRAANPGEFTEVWRKHLINHRAPFDVYSWVSADWVLRKVRLGCKPLRIGNLDKLPPQYPREWREKIEACVSAVSAAAEANRQLDEMRQQVAELKNGATETGMAEAQGRAGRKRTGNEDTLGAAR